MSETWSTAIGVCIGAFAMGLTRGPDPFDKGAIVGALAVAAIPPIRRWVCARLNQILTRPR